MFYQYGKFTNTGKRYVMGKTILQIVIVATIVVSSSSTALAIGQCPAIGQSTSCSILITIKPNGSLTFQTDPSVRPFDGIEDVLVGVTNQSGATVFGISLTGSDIFGFDGDGVGTFIGNQGPTGYEGPGTSFSSINANRGTVNFTNGLDDKGFIWFSLEGAPTQVRLSQRVTIDPGHGSSCAAVKQPVGTVGVTDYPATSPPAGKLMEDVLTVAVANRLNGILANQGFDVHLTKTDSVSCPTYLERGAIANKARSNIFISIHFNRPRINIFGIGSGTIAFYNSAKSSSQTLADLTASAVSGTVGVNNRGSSADNNLAVLKTTTSRMTAILTEVGRLSAPDEDIIHDPNSITRAAVGFTSGINTFLAQ